MSQRAWEIQNGYFGTEPRKIRSRLPFGYCEICEERTARVKAKYVDANICFDCADNEPDPSEVAQ